MLINGQKLLLLLCLNVNQLQESEKNLTLDSAVYIISKFDFGRVVPVKGL